MLTAKVFKNGRSQAVRLPKECRFTSKELGVVRVNNVVILFPASDAMDVMKSAIGQFSEDFMASRDQPKSVDKRVPFD